MEMIHPREKEILQKLKSADQLHIIEAYQSSNSNKDKNQLIETLAHFDDWYGGSGSGIKQYRYDVTGYINGREEHTEDWKIDIPVEESTRLSLRNPDDIEKAEKIGVEKISKMAVLILAGGVGQRLGHSRIKLELEFENIFGSTYLGLYMEYIKSLQSHVLKFKGIFVEIPIIFMVSVTTHQQIIEHLKENNYFEMNKSQFWFMEQSSIPCVNDEKGSYVWLNRDQLILDMSPYGHGECHSLMHLTGFSKKLIEMGKEWIMACNDTNPLTFRFTAAFLGRAEEQKLDFGYVCVPRVPGEKVGSIAKLTHKKTGVNFVTNIEYCVFSNYVENEDLDEFGFSVFPGNTNIILIRLKKYEKTLRKTLGRLPVLFNPKFDKTGKMMPSRVETLIADYPRYVLFDGVPSMKVGAIQVDRLMAFTCAKNSLEIGKELIGSGNGRYVDTLMSCEADWYRSNCELFIACGGEFENKKGLLPKSTISIPHPTLDTIRLTRTPIVSIMPSFGSTFTEIKKKIGKSVNISEKSILALSGDIQLGNLSLNGGIVVRSDESFVLEGKVENSGNIEWVCLDHSHPTRGIHGYHLQKTGIWEIYKF